MRARTVPVILFEPAGCEGFGPPVALRPCWELRVGARRLVERVLDQVPADSLHFWSRPSLRALCPPPPEALFDAGDLLLVAGNLLLLGDARLEALAPGERVEVDGQVVALRLAGSVAREFLASQQPGATWPDPAPKARECALGAVLQYWWELYEQAPRALAADRGLLLGTGAWRREDRMDWVAAEDVHLAADAEIAAGAMVDASGGPVLIDRGVRVGPLSVIQGPCYVGPGTRLKPHTQLLHGCFVGPECRLGGEIEEAQFQGYANKQHHGFLGHAAVGEWVNLGAGVTNSDLKNNYSDVRVLQAGRELQSRRRFLGCCLGDHVKVGIQGRINTGTVLEPFTNWFGADFPPKGLPAFLWGSEAGTTTYALDKALETAAIVMQRRGRSLDAALARTITDFFAATEPSRATLRA